MGPQCPEQLAAPLKGENMRAWLIKFHASCMNGTASYLVVEETKEKAEVLFEEYIKQTEDGYFWEKAKKEHRFHTGGYVVWGEKQEEKAPGVYPQPYDRWNSASDHLWD